jgi:hypothetical protein
MVKVEREWGIGEEIGDEARMGIRRDENRMVERE